MKRLPVAALPEGGAGTWSVADTERWRTARVPVIFTPVAGSWGAAVAVVVSYVLTSAFSSSSVAWHGGAGVGTEWLRYPGAVLLAALPLWYRYLPVPAGVAGAVVAVDAGFSVAAADSGTERAGHVLVLTVCAWALTGACLRLRARRGSPDRSTGRGPVRGRL
ncbi:hypothetical protein [Streptomyces sp. N35]|uniref:hypothetical protein n=1 Tax=Streptomyces sp. N35 TaxID=2795730 RepID=UPI001F46A0D0|nr:hypothetical protein [Streptomyces sp. N35]